MLFEWTKHRATDATKFYKLLRSIAKHYNEGDTRFNDSGKYRVDLGSI